jgi:glycosyltransferase involved in cell wall biosynthesis
VTERLTIAIPFHRGLDYLGEAIESVRSQTRGDWRLLVCDDRGEDGGVEELVRSFADPRIELRRNERNLGMVRNWNHCIDLAETELVTLLHADDRLLPEYAELMLALAQRHPRAAALFCDAEIIDAAGRRAFSLADAVKRLFVPAGERDVVLEGEEALRIVMAGNFIMCPTLCLRKPQLAARRFSTEWRQVQDLEFTSRLLMEGETLAGSRRAGYAYRRHPGNATELHSENLLRFEEEFQLFARVGERATELGWPRAARVARRAGIVKLHLLYRSLRDLARLRPSVALRKLRFLARHWSPHSP